MEPKSIFSSERTTTDSEKSSLSDIYFNRFTIIIPAYNEEKRISFPLSQLCYFILEAKTPWDIIVSIDGNDGTESLIKEMMKNFPFLMCLKGNGREGKGNAIKRAINIAKGKYFILMDADNAISLKELLRFIPEIVGNDVVILERYTLDKSQIPLKRKMVSRVFNLLVRSTLGIRVNDTQSGYKIMNAEYARKAFNSITVTNAFYDVALLYKIKKLGGKIIEKPAIYKHNVDSKFSIISLVFGLGVSLLAFRIRYSPFYKYIPAYVKLIYYNKFRWI